MSRFLKLLNSVLNEQEDPNALPPPPPPPSLEGGSEGEDIGQPPTPETLDSNEDSALPEPEDVAMDVEKYRLLLDALRKALLSAYKGNFETKREISNIKIDVDDLKQLQKIEDKLMNFLEQVETPSSVED